MINKFIFGGNMHKGLTMAEVLITLGIIGIVAAMTLPSLVGKYQKVQTVNQLKKAYSVLAQAIELSEVQNEHVKYWDFNLTSADFFERYLLPYIAKINNTTYGTISDKIRYMRPNGTVENNFNPFLADSHIITMNDGTTLYLPDSGIYHYKVLCLDLNGYKKPNRFGRDFFVFSIHKDFGLVPYGYQGSSDVDSYTTFDRENIKNAPRYGCSKNSGTTNGAFCSALIMTDGWEIRDDYPW